MNIKKFSAGAWISCAAAVLALAALIAYAVNISGAGYFQNASVTNLVLFNILAILGLAVAVVAGQLEPKGAAATAVELVTGAVQILVPVLLAFCLINLVAARAQGLSFIFLSNADVIMEVQTPANMASATGTIVNMVFLAVAMVVSIVGAFCNVKKKVR